MKRRGRVFIAPVNIPEEIAAEDAADLFGVPAHARFSASWEIEDAVGDSVYFRTAEEALIWGRARARVVLIRFGSHGDEGRYFSAGEAPVFDNDGQPLPTWPPHRQ